jgi:hypothetical protein
MHLVKPGIHNYDTVCITIINKQQASFVISRSSVRKRLVTCRDGHEKRRSREIGLECRAAVLNPTAGYSIAGANRLGGRESKVRSGVSIGVHL